MKRALALVAVIALVSASAVVAQRRGGRGGGGLITIATPQDFDGGFQFCRIAFRQNRAGDGGGWSVDYPRADQNLSIRLSELTKTHVSFDASHDPKHLVMRLTDETIFQCPFMMMTEPGGAFLEDAEAAALRNYLLKGGFLWADDFWGEYAWEAWADQLRKAMPAGEFPIVDLPMDHPMFRSQFIIDKVPQIPSINYWAGSGGDTSERGQDSAVAHARAILDKHGRIMVLMTHNTDLGDSWEQEALNPQYFLEMSVPGYAFGVNVVLYALTH